MKPPVDVKKIMQEIKEAAIAQLQSEQNSNATYVEGQSVIHSEELSYLNTNWHNLLQKQEIVSHRNNLLGKLIIRIKQFVTKTIDENLLKGYFDRERNFNRNLVAYLNLQIKYVDDKHKEVFIMLHEKVDHEVADILDRCDLVVDEALLRAEEKIAALEERIKKLELKN